MHELMPVDISSPIHKANPFPFYARLRRNSPVIEVTLPSKSKAWLVTRYEDVAFVLKDDRFAKDRFRTLSNEQAKKLPWMPAIIKPLTRNMLDLDPPDHTRLKALVQLAFTPKRVEAMRPRIESLSRELMASLVEKPRKDLIHDFALPLPSTVIAEMLGVPVNDRHKFHRWSNRIMSMNWSTWDTLKAIPSVWRFLRYVRKLIQSRRSDPKSDMISALAEAEAAGDRMSEDELVAMVFLLLIAGHETTVNLIGNGMLALMQHPDQLEKLRQDPSLIESAVEELLRFASPVETATERYTREDVEVAGVTIPQGSMVYPVIASANRDESQFANPDELDICRDPNRHLSFGMGIHYCLGSSLARLEAQIAINTLLERPENWKLAVPENALKWRGGMVIRGMKGLPVELVKQDAALTVPCLR
jgi:cytochrome P450 PksS